ncbi:MAG TPA: recombination mediator RecR [Candidatus Magasanikbacteria bacterium]|jgi:recombination protein RecR|nr:recombination mediator RecR [Candidatus Magasanikbacteria bacterium]HQL52746.1 recombination mediator RecR [Candidatus Magasanikbacteria bacterium]
MYSKPIQELINAFAKLPSVGERTAERYVFHLLRSGKKDVAELTLALKDLIDNIKSCETCWNFSDSNPCPICIDNKRDHTTICVVANFPDIEAIEKIGFYSGVYHVLRGTIKADDELDNLKIKELLKRIKLDKNLQEIILALNPNLEGETTMMYLQREIKKINPNLNITRLARGLPMGSDLQYADEITLESALKNRTK